MFPKPKRIKNKNALARRGYCQLCGRGGYTEMHHIKSRGSGGDDVAENVCELCKICHSKAHSAQISKAELLKLKES